MRLPWEQVVGHLPQDIIAHRGVDTLKVVDVNHHRSPLMHQVEVSIEVSVVTEHADKNKRALDIFHELLVKDKEPVDGQFEMMQQHLSLGDHIRHKRTEQRHCLTSTRTSSVHKGCHCAVTCLRIIMTSHVHLVLIKCVN